MASASGSGSGSGTSKDEKTTKTATGSEGQLEPLTSQVVRAKIDLIKEVTKHDKWVHFGRSRIDIGNGTETDVCFAAIQNGPQSPDFVIKVVSGKRLPSDTVFRVSPLHDWASLAEGDCIRTAALGSMCCVQRPNSDKLLVDHDEAKSLKTEVEFQLTVLSPAVSVLVRDDSIRDGLWNSQQRGKGTDVCLVTRDGKIPAHRIVLSACSEELERIYFGARYHDADGKTRELEPELELPLKHVSREAALFWLEVVYRGVDPLKSEAPAVAEARPSKFRVVKPRSFRFWLEIMDICYRMNTRKIPLTIAEHHACAALDETTYLEAATCAFHDQSVRLVKALDGFADTHPRAILRLLQTHASVLSGADARREARTAKRQRTESLDSENTAVEASDGTASVDAKTVASSVSVSRNICNFEWTTADVKHDAWKTFGHSKIAIGDGVAKYCFAIRAGSPTDKDHIVRLFSDCKLSGRVMARFSPLKPLWSVIEEAASLTTQLASPSGLPLEHGFGFYWMYRSKIDELKDEVKIELQSIPEVCVTVNTKGPTDVFREGLWDKRKRGVGADLVRIITSDGDVHAHRLVLAAASPRLEAMCFNSSISKETSAASETVETSNGACLTMKTVLSDAVLYWLEVIYRGIDPLVSETTAPTREFRFWLDVMDICVKTETKDAFCIAETRACNAVNKETFLHAATCKFHDLSPKLVLALVQFIKSNPEAVREVFQTHAALFSESIEQTAAASAGDKRKRGLEVPRAASASASASASAIALDADN